MQTALDAADPLGRDGGENKSEDKILELAHEMKILVGQRNNVRELALADPDKSISELLKFCLISGLAVRGIFHFDGDAK